METGSSAGDVDDVWSALNAATVDVAQEWLVGLGFNQGAPDELLIELLDVPVGSRYWHNLLFRAELPDAVVEAAVGHPERRIRMIMAETGRLTAEQWERLLVTFEGDPVRGGLAELRDDLLASRSSPRPGRGIDMPPHPDAVPPSTPAEIAEWAAEVPDISPDAQSHCLWWVGALHGDAEAMRQLAASSNLEIRRSVARAPHLPSDVLERLARDEDRVVRLFLSESCEDTPAAVLLDVWSWWPGSLSFPGRPRNHPNFPTTGLLHHADAPEPRMRLLALSDRDASTELVDRLAADPEPQVRLAAVGDPRISPAVLAEALLDERFARAAAKNPALPVPVMRRMMDVARRAG